MKKYRGANKAKINEQRREYSKTGNGKVKQKEYRDKYAKTDNGKDILKRNQNRGRDRKRDKGYDMYYENRRRIIATGGPVTDIKEEKTDMVSFYGEARRLREGGMDVEIDHKIPVNGILKDGRVIKGGHTLKNIQIVTRAYNVVKRDVVDESILSDFTEGVDYIIIDTE